MFKLPAEFVFMPPSLSAPLTARFDGRRLRISGHGPTLSLDVSERAGRPCLSVVEARSEDSPVALALAMELLFGHDVESTHLHVSTGGALGARLAAWGFRGESDFVVARRSFFQLPVLWHRRGEAGVTFEVWSETSGRAHPVRPRLAPGTLYRRHVAKIGRTLAFRTADVERDLDVFHAWHNDPRVSGLWELNRPKEELRAYLERGLADAHQVPLIFEVDGQAAGYFEAYWAPEDRLGPYYEYEPFDRGFHFLIGGRSFLGKENTKAAIASIMHYLYLEDPRTRRVVAEPRADNQLAIRYARLVPGWRIVKEFDFPHKRAALLMAKREDYFLKGAP